MGPLWIGLVGASLAADGDDAEQWRETLDRVTRSVVSIRMDRPRAFEGNSRGNSQATGFVIDAELGLILTNRHVVTAAPVLAQAVFLNNEEVELVPVYRDPVHDFGLFRYDPSKLRFITPEALRLAPEDAQVGVEIRVVGNDSGERLSILDGTIARLDRPAPVYGGGYSDFDTFYIQAASATSGGSSGSPIVDVDGDVVAMNAGGKSTAATSFYLPLQRVVRAVELLRENQAVPRGTVQTRLEYTPYDELRKLALSPAQETAARARRPTATGMLVVREVLPEGPAAGQLEIGDVLIEAGGAPVMDFVTWEALLDGQVGATIAVEVERAGAPVSVVLPVGDLHALVPSRLLEIGGGTVHDLSVHQARTSQIPVRGVFVAEAGRMFGRGGVPESAVLVDVAGTEIRDLDDLLEVLADIPDGAPFAVRWFPTSRPSQGVESAVRMDRRWFPMRTCSRADDGSWPCVDLPVPTATAEPRASVRVGLSPVDDKVGAKVQPSLVGVRTEVPYPVAGLGASTYGGGGLVVDAERGLVIVDRDTVPIALADVRLLLGGAVEIPARVVALHEVHNLALVAYDPAAAGDIVLQSAVFAPDAFTKGDKVTFVGLEGDGGIETSSTVVQGIEPFGVRADGAPRFRETNLDVIDLEDRPAGMNGVLVDKKGRVGAFWASFSYNDGRELRATWQAIPADIVQDTLALADGVGGLRTLGWELGVTSIVTAMERGLPAAEAERLVRHDPDRRAVLQIVRLEAGDPAGDVLRPGDFVLAIDGTPVVRFREVEVALRDRDSVRLTVCRGGRVESVEVRPRPLDSIDVDRVLLWAGLRLHAPDRSARLFGVAPHRPYVTWLDSGSPAGRAKLYAQRTILQVDGEDVADLDAFVAKVSEGAPDRTVRLVVVTKDGERELITMDLDEQFFRSEALVWRGRAWEREPLRAEPLPGAP